MENETKKISLSTFLLILAVIIIAIMGVFIFKLNNEKNIETQTTTSNNLKSEDIKYEISTRKNTPNPYYALQILGEKEVARRIDLVLAKLN